MKTIEELEKENEALREFAEVLCNVTQNQHQNLLVIGGLEVYEVRFNKDVFDDQASKFGFLPKKPSEVPYHEPGMPFN